MTKKRKKNGRYTPPLPRSFDMSKFVGIDGVHVMGDSLVIFDTTQLQVEDGDIFAAMRAACPHCSGEVIEE